jgi:hypothetical protein
MSHVGDEMKVIDSSSSGAGAEDECTKLSKPM